MAQGHFKLRIDRGNWQKMNVAHSHFKFSVASGHFKFSAAHSIFKFSVANGHFKFSVAHGHFKFLVAHGHLQIPCGTQSFKLRMNLIFDFSKKMLSFLMRVQSSNATGIPGLPISDWTVDGRPLLRGS